MNRSRDSTSDRNACINASPHLTKPDHGACPRQIGTVSIDMYQNKPRYLQVKRKVVKFEATADRSSASKVAVIAKVIEVEIIKELAYDVLGAHFRYNIATIKVVIDSTPFHNLKVTASMGIINIEVMVDH